MTESVPTAAPRIAIVGAGPGGTRAAEALVRHGFRPAVFSESWGDGGQIYRRQPDGFRRSYRKVYGFEAAKAEKLHAAFDAIRPSIDYRPDTPVWDIAGSEVVTGPADAPQIEHFETIVLASGAVDRIYPIANWTLPGIYSLGGAQIALKAQGCVIGGRPLFVGTGPLLYLVAWQYLKAGVRPAAIIDTAPAAAGLGALAGLAAADARALAKGLWFYGSLKLRRIPIFQGALPRRFLGAGGLEGLEFQHRGRIVTVEADAAGLGFGLMPEAQLADLAGCAFAWAPAARQHLPVRDDDLAASHPGLRLVGDGAAILGADAAEASGELAGLLVARGYGAVVDAARIAALRGTMARARRFQAALARAFPPPDAMLAATPDDCVVCRCENVTAAVLRDAVTRGGFADINHIKAATRLGMGRCQGRLCGAAALDLIAQAAGRDPGSVGRLRAQPPVKPVPIGMPSAR